MRIIPTILLIVTGVVFGVSAWYALGRRIARGERYSPYSTYRSDRVGTRRLFLFYEDAGFAPVRLKRELLMLEEKGLLFIIEPQRAWLPTMTGAPLAGYGLFMPQELDAIVAWVSEGNSLVLAASEHTELHERLGIEVESGAPGRTQDAHRVQASALTRALPKLRTRRDSRLILEEPSWVELFALPADGEAELLVQAAVRKLGRGTVVVLSDPFVLTNKGILSGANLALAVRLTGLRSGGAVYFDEFHHGFSDPRTIISYVRVRGLHFALLQAIAVFVLFAWRSRSRLGRPRRPGGQAERGSAEYVRAFSLIYRRAHLHGSVIQSAYEQFKEKTALWAGAGRSSMPDEVRRILEGRNKKAASLFAAITARATAPGRSASNAEVLSFIRSIARFEKEFVDAGRARKVT